MQPRDGIMLLYSMLVLQNFVQMNNLQNQRKPTIAAPEKERAMQIPSKGEKTPNQADATSSGAETNKETNSETKGSSKEPMEGTPMALIKAINIAMLSGVSPYGKQTSKQVRNTPSTDGVIFLITISIQQKMPSFSKVLSLVQLVNSINGGASICLTASKQIYKTIVLLVWKWV